MGGEREKVVARASALVLRGLAVRPSLMLSVYDAKKKNKRMLAV